MTAVQLSSNSQIDLKAFLPQIPDFSKQRIQATRDPSKLQYQFFRIDEISENSALENRLAMGNVIAGLANQAGNQAYSIVYLLSGKPKGVSLYMGLAGEGNISPIAQQLESAFKGNFAGARLKSVNSAEIEPIFAQSQHLGVISGVPSEDEQQEDSTIQGVERLINALSGEYWQMVVIVEPGHYEEIERTLHRLCRDASELSQYIKSSQQYSQNRGQNLGYTQGTNESDTVGSSTTKSQNESFATNKGQSSGKSSSSNGSSSSTSSTANESSGTSRSTGSSYSDSQNSSQTKGINTSVSKGENKGESRTIIREQINKRVEMLYRYWNEIQIPRFQQGLGKGMYRTAIYLCAENEGVFHRLSQNVVSIYQSNRPTLYPLRAETLNVKNKGFKLGSILQIRHFSANESLRYQHNLPYDGKNLKMATWLTAQELSLFLGLPNREVAGLKLRKNVPFAVNTGSHNGERINLGHIVQDGRILRHNPMCLEKSSLDKHIFVTGVTGSGKTTTCMQLLLASKLPFTVIEPAKTEYRALYAQNSDICYYALGNEQLTTFRLNPFELVSPEQSLSGHIGMLQATLTAVFPMEASMPYIIEKAMIQAYEKRGWDIALNKNYLTDDPWQSEENVFPTFTDVIAELDNVIRDAKMGEELSARYRGSLVSRLESLITGVRGTMINTPRSIDFDQLLDQNTVFELEDLKNEEDKAFFMGLIIGRLAECIKHRHTKQPDFRHISLIEEAHRLLSKPDLGDDGAKKLGVEMFANLLAEVRKYGECLVIADQIPNKLVPDVIKNTNTKIVHRLFAADDCDSIGNSIGLNHDQKTFLSQLRAGETIIYSGGWHAAVRAKIDQTNNTTAQVLSVDIIRQQGAKQLWQQRQKLFPRLAQQALFNPQNFAKTVNQLREQLVMLMRLLKSQNNGNTALQAKIWQRFCQLTQQMQQELSIDNDTTSKLWVAILQDSDVYDSGNKFAFDGNQIVFTTLFSIICEHLNGSFDECSAALKNNVVTNSANRLELFYQRYFS